MNKAIVTVLLGKYDQLKPAPKFKGWDTILFTDQYYPDLKGWTIHKVKSNDPAIDSRYYKWLTHITLPMYQTVCYVDASMTFKKEPPSEPTFFKHPARTNVETEGARIVQLHKADKKQVLEQLEHYKENGFKDDHGLYQNGFFVRTHDIYTNDLCETVYELVTQFTGRDQLAMPYALFKTKYKPLSIRPGIESKEYITIYPHDKEPVIKLKPLQQYQKAVILPKRNEDVAVHHITPGRSDLNLGKAINDIVRVLPDNCWICLRDIDTMPSFHEVFFKQVEDIAKNTTFGLIGCMTNRLGLRYQLHSGTSSNDTNWINHRKIGKERYEMYGSHVEPTTETLAGLFMLFPKKVWMAVGGFPEGNIRINGSFIDYHFSIAVKNKGYKSGIASGIYLIHMYRPDATNPRNATQHLETKIK